MRVKIFVLGLVSLFFVSCAELMVYHRVNYDIALDEVERPAEAKERYGEQKISKMEEGEYNYLFEDEMIKILWIITEEKIGFLLENKTDHSLRIIWDEATYVDPNGMSHRVIHSGIKYADRDKTMPPSVVVRKGKLLDIIHPSDYVHYVRGYGLSTGGWQEDPLLPNKKSGGTPQELLNESKEFVGKTIQILLPIQIEEVTNDYIFSFKVNDVKLALRKQP
jgi:hypothetical protein